METIKKKMATLRETLSEAEKRADTAEKDLKDANDRAANVSRLLWIDVRHLTRASLLDGSEFVIS